MRMLICITVSVFLSLGIVYFVLKRKGVLCDKKKCSCKGKKVSKSFTDKVIKDTNEDGVVTVGELLNNLGINI